MNFDAVAIDFETTGSVPGFPVEPWQVGLAPIHRKDVSSENLFESLLRIDERPFNRYAPGRHAKLRVELASSPSFHDIWPILEKYLCGQVLIAHNVGTERSMLSPYAPLHCPGPWIDTLVLSRLAWPQLESYALEYLIVRLKLHNDVMKLCPGRSYHDALFDATACAILFLHLRSQPGWDSIPVEELVEMCGGSLE